MHKNRKAGNIPMRENMIKVVNVFSENMVKF